MNYRGVVNRRTAAWALAAAASRLPVAMAPLALLFLGHAGSGRYSSGGELAAFFVVGEVVGSWALGRYLRPQRLRLHLAVGFAVGAAAFAVLALADRGPLWISAVAAFAGGAAPAASPGALRTVLTSIVPEEDVARAFSLDSVLTELLWLAAPGVVVLLALHGAAWAPAAVCAVCQGLAVPAVATLAAARAVEEESAAAQRPDLAVVLSAWPIYLTSAAAMALMAVSELVLPALLGYRGDAVGIAGLLLTVFSALSAAGAFCYGLRSWPFSARTQSLICLLGTALGIAVMAVSPGLAGITAGFLVAGVFQAVVMVTRNLSLREFLPKEAHTAGYSVMYAVQGVGYSVSALFASVALDHGGPPTAALVGVALSLLLTLVSAQAERRTATRARRSASQSPSMAGDEVPVGGGAGGGPDYAP